MNFECKKLDITDDPVFGCTIEFTDTIETDSEDMTIEELYSPTVKYLLIQRSYPEEVDEKDWYTIETSEANINFSQKDKMYVTLSPNRFEIYCSGEKIVIGLNLSEKKYKTLEKTLKNQFREMVVLLKN